MQTATQDSFATLVLDQDTVFVEFSSPWCPPCRALQAALEDACAKRPSLRAVHVDVSDHPALGQTYRVSSVPTLVAFRKGQPVGVEVGYAGPARLQRFLDRHA
ncbi:MAG: thioredoxin family protein [Myxococcota bacterium]